MTDSIIVGQGSVILNGKALETEDIINFRESVIALKDNWARRVIHEQVRYLATNLGVYKSVSLDELYFFKAALWCLSEEDKLISQIV